SMRRLTGVLAVIALMLGATGQANAVLMLTGSGGAVLYQGPADYVTTSGTFTGAESTIIGMALTLGPNPLNATYSNSDVDFISNGKGGFAWSERILNSSGQAWNGLTVQINGGVPNFGDFVVTPISPIRVAISNLPPVPLTNPRSEEHTSELQSRVDLVCRLLPPPATTPPLPLSLHTLFRSH